MKKNLIVGQSGGPTCVINSSLYGVITMAQKESDSIETIYGMVNGIEGLLKDTILSITEQLKEDELEAIKTTPGAYLGSCRYKLPTDLADEVYEILFQKLEKLNIGYFLYIGGNDSMDTVSKLSRYAAQIQSSIRFIGIPKTIDNDLILTDHTPGFGSAAKFVASTVREIAIDASIYDAPSVTIVEIMGRNAGWLTASSVLARKVEHDNPVLIYLPETDFYEAAFLKEVQQQLTKTKNLVVCVSEGLHDKDGHFICEKVNSVAVDTFGHKVLAGCGKYLENLIKKNFAIKVRSIELNVTQRCSSSLLSETDLSEAASAGREGVAAALRNETGKMVAFTRTSNSPYELTYELVDVNEVCNQEKKVPADWITKQGTDLSDAFIEYALPLIQGNVSIPQKDGLPFFAYRK